MNINELEMLREQVRIQAEKIASLSFEVTRNQAIIAILTKPEHETQIEETVENKEQ